MTKAEVLDTVEINGQTVKVGDVLTATTFGNVQTVTIVKLTSSRITVRREGWYQNDCWGHKYVAQRSGPEWENWTAK
jgi:hypothetical protein